MKVLRQFESDSNWKCKLAIHKFIVMVYEIGDEDNVICLVNKIYNKMILGVSYGHYDNILVPIILKLLEAYRN